MQDIDLFAIHLLLPRTLPDHIHVQRLLARITRDRRLLGCHRHLGTHGVSVSNDGAVLSVWKVWKFLFYRGSQCQSTQLCTVYRTPWCSPLPNTFGNGVGAARPRTVPRTVGTSTL